MTIIPTFEQKIALDLATSRKTFKMSAYAGSGKTSTLKLIGDALSPKNGLYLAFNKAIADEAKKKFSSNVECRTFHSIAYRATPKHITSKLKGVRLLPKKMAMMFDLRDYVIPLAVDNSKIATCDSYDQAMILTRSINIFCRSIAREVTQEILLESMPKWADKNYCVPLAEALVDKARRLWSYFIDYNSNYKITHDVYLKHWALTNPTISAEFILFDEAQDADPVMLDVLSKQTSQVIYVGDKHQQIYAFRGAINAMQSLHIREAFLTKSFRFGEEVADVANSILVNLLDEKKPLIGNEIIDSKVSTLDLCSAYLARTNAAALHTGLKLSLAGHRPKINLDTESLLLQIADVEKLKNNQSLDKKSDFFGFENWSDVLSYIEEYPKSDLTPIVTLIESHELQFLKETIDKLSQVEDGDCIVSTAHKAKGLEFDSVKLCDDYFWSSKDGEPLMIPSEARLLYVACTRAINNLDVSEMQVLFNKLNKKTL